MRRQIGIAAGGLRRARADTARYGVDLRCSVKKSGEGAEADAWGGEIHYHSVAKRTLRRCGVSSGSAGGISVIGPLSGRRDFLKSAVGCALGATLGIAARPLSVAAATTAGAAEGALRVTELTDSLTLIEGAGGNVVLFTASEGALLIDGGLAEHSAALLQLVEARAGGRPVKVLFNTHWHWDHTGSNEQLARAGARILAHENTRLWLGADFYVEWQDREYKPRPPQALPTETFFDGGGELEFGGERIVYRHLPRAHTDGDIYVHFPGQDVLVVGDLLAVGSYPILDYSTGGWIGGLADATKALVDLAGADTRVVPGHGPVQSRADLEAQHEMLVTMKDRLADLMRKGMNADDMLAERPSAEFDARWGDPTLFVRNAYRGMWGHVRSLGGIV